MLKMARLGALAVATVLLLTACGTESTPTPVSPAGGRRSEPTPTLTEVQATPTPAVSTPTTTANAPTEVGAQTSGGNTCAGVALSSVRLDTMGLPYSWQPSCVEATPYDRSQPPGPKGLPQHIQINFGVVDPKSVKPNDPIIYVIPAAEYAKMYNDNNDPSVSNVLAKLSTMLKDKPEPIPTSGMPVLPFERVPGPNDLSVQGKYLTVQSGNGVRFVGRFAQSPVPVSNDNPQMFYIYQGYSPGETYLVSFFFPVTTRTLPMSTAVVEAERAQVESDPAAYMQEKAKQLNALPESEWNPNLSQLDAVINSLSFGK